MSAIQAILTVFGLIGGLIGIVVFFAGAYEKQKGMRLLLLSPVAILVVIFMVRSIFYVKIDPPQGFSCGIYDCVKGDTAFKEICDKEKIGNFIVECARAANPMSDEEGEDLVKECGQQAKITFCERETIILK